MIAARFCTVVALATSLFCTGCSSLGLSLFPTGHFLTDRAEAVVAAAPASAAIARERNKDVVPVHYLQPGDVLLVEPTKSGDEIRIPADQTIMLDGSIDLGGFGRIVLAGLAIEDAEVLIEQTVFDFLPDGSELKREDVDINVRLIEPMHRYYVLGEVNSPGAYTLRGFETVLDGILEAGGLTTTASNCGIILSRPTDPCSCRVTLPICYREITQLGDTTTNYQLRPGDRIYVSTRGCCDEMKFWKANESCEKCDRCQTVCCNPAAADFNNPMASVTPAPIPAGRPAPALNEKMIEDGPDATLLDTPAGTKLPPSANTMPSPAAENQSLEPTFPELMQPPGGFDLQVPATSPASPAPSNMDGELDLEITPRQSRRFQPMWLK